jgi:hypothetical protein
LLLHQLCAPLPDRFLVGLATLNLLAEAPEERPLLCLVDDAQWLDAVSAQILAFVARRVEAEQVALVLGMREPTDAHPFTGLNELRLSGLDAADSPGAAGRSGQAPLDERVCDRITAEAPGNPLALLELPRGEEAAQLAGGFGRPDALSVPRRIEEGFRRRWGSLARRDTAAAGRGGRATGRCGAAVARPGGGRGH